MEHRTIRPRELSRRDFLKVGGAGLAGAALLGAAGCGGGEQSGGATELYYHCPGRTRRGPHRSSSASSTRSTRASTRSSSARATRIREQRLDKLRTQFQAGGEELDVILGDVIWTAELAESGWISDLSDRFPESQQKAFLPGSVEAIIYNGKPYAMPWYTDTGLLYYRKDLLKRAATTVLRRPGTSSSR